MELEFVDQKRKGLAQKLDEDLEKLTLISKRASRADPDITDPTASTPQQDYEVPIIPEQQQTTPRGSEPPEGPRGPLPPLPERPTPNRIVSPRDISSQINQVTTIPPPESTTSRALTPLTQPLAPPLPLPPLLERPTPNQIVSPRDSSSRLNQIITIPPPPPPERCTTSRAHTPPTQAMAPHVPSPQIPQYPIHQLAPVTNSSRPQHEENASIIKIKTPHITASSFDGQNMGVEKFIEEYERAGSLNGWNESLMVHYLPVYLKGWPQTVYYNAIQDNPAITWGDLKRRMLEIFQPSYATREIKLTEVLQRVQGPFEAATKYFSEKMAMIRKLEMHFSEAEICRFIVLGLSPDIIGKLVMKDEDTTTLVSLERALIKFENAKFLVEFQAKRQRAMLGELSGSNPLTMEGPKFSEIACVSDAAGFDDPSRGCYNRNRRYSPRGAEREEGSGRQSPSYRPHREDYNNRSQYYSLRDTEREGRSDRREPNYNSYRNRSPRSSERKQERNNEHPRRGRSPQPKTDRKRSDNKSRQRAQGTYTGCFVCGDKSHRANTCKDRFQSKN
ncbi:uncharacterized protein LOC113467908 [Diaphorina citri]|uniref:Uncharacterized protein LOC113467908 n=1 Tax=Diaphorina citri TaxID=121845 RepID=A0A3Q0IV90_DIACI|nr:uncharacterized protein LOC113467908 [Diaphorina citri]